jgi:MFS family permease
VSTAGPAQRDRRLLYAAALLRAVATGMIGVVLALHLGLLGAAPKAVGFVVSAGLSGAALAALVATLAGDRRGHRRLLLELATLGAAGTALLAVVQDVGLAGAAAFVGMVNAMGRDRGAALVIEQAMLPATAVEAERTRVFAWYHLLQDAGHALGGVLAGLPSLLVEWGILAPIPAFRLSLLLVAGLIAGTALCYAGLSPRAEAPRVAAATRLSPESRGILFRLSALFALDAFAGGFLSGAMLTVFFHERFGVEAATLGLLFAGARVANGLSHLVAAWLARRIGLVNTMVFTHIPSSLLLVTVTYAPTFGVAAALFLLREGLVEMDVPTRQSYVMAVVRPEERLVASGVTHLVRLAGWAAGPVIGGILMQDVALGTPFVVAAAMKIAYDGLLWAAFRRHRPPEERVQIA